MNNIQAYIENRRKLGYNDQKIKEELLGSGWKEEDINNYLTAKTQKLTGREILNRSPKYKTYQKIIIGWLITYLLLRVLLALLLIRVASEAGAKVITFAVLINLIFILPGIIVLIGLLKVKAWAYWFYLLGLFFGLNSFMNADNIPELVVSLILSFGSLIIFILTIILYRNIFPSKKSQASRNITQK